MHICMLQVTYNISNKLWNNYLVIDCGDPPKVANAAIDYHHNNNTHIGSQVRYICRPGYSLVNEPDLICSQDGLWIPNDLPICVGNEITFMYKYKVPHTHTHTWLYKICSNMHLLTNSALSYTLRAMHLHTGLHRPNSHWKQTFLAIHILFSIRPLLNSRKFAS